MPNEPISPLRRLDLIPFEQDGETLVVMRDGEGISENAISMPIATLMLASLFDGARTAHEVQLEFMSRHGHYIPPAEIESLAAQLDELGFIDSAAFARRRSALEAEYAALPIRPAAHAGQSYPAGREECLATFRSWFDLEDGAGALGERDLRGSGRSLAGLIIPHMDPRCSGATISHAIKAAAAEQPAPEIFVIFGTSHQPLPNLFSVSDKDFETPFGVVPADKPFVARLRELCGEQRLSGEFRHRNEHSIEFPVVFLHALYQGNPAPFTVVPILCNSLHRWVEGKDTPAANEEMRSLCAAVRDAVAASGKRVCFVSGSDLAHVGKKFGDEGGAGADVIADVRRRDLATLGLLEKADREGFFRDIQAEHDWRKICGLPPTYAMLGCMDASEGKLLKYDAHLEPETDSMVSFCSMAFYK